jgi:protein phosphatase 1L
VILIEQTSKLVILMASSWSCGVAEGRGTRAHMEDRYCIVEDMRDLKETLKGETWSFFGVYDGHGGDVTSSLLAERLHKDVADQSTFPEDIPAAMEAGLQVTDKAFSETHPNLWNDGSTVVFAVMTSFLGAPQSFWVANSGDSRAILVKHDGTTYKGKALSEDHKPNRPDEKERIEKAGGFVKETSVSALLRKTHQLMGLALWYLRTS